MLYSLMSMEDGLSVMGDCQCPYTTTMLIDHSDLVHPSSVNFSEINFIAFTLLKFGFLSIVTFVFNK